VAKFAEHVSRPFLAASAYMIRRSMREYALADRPHAS
jgi:hypothetical protein